MVDFPRFKYSGRGGNQMNMEQARFNMVEQQIRPWEVLDQQVLDLLMEVRREEFVPEQYRALAFVDMEIPLGQGEVMLAPKIEARILQELAIKKTDRILEVGTGSGYFTALLARLGGHVYSVDIVPEFVAATREKLAAHAITNVTLEVGDAARGWSRHGPYDAIVLTGSEPALSPAFEESLEPGGRLFAIIGDPPVMEATLITCVSEGVFNAVPVFETCVAPLRNAPHPARFVF
jgi:protein-L-isoaspartate(D-aspartate) O-methyltransferase